MLFCNTYVFKCWESDIVRIRSNLTTFHRISSSLTKFMMTNRQDETQKQLMNIRHFMQFQTNSPIDDSHPANLAANHLTMSKYGLEKLLQESLRTEGFKAECTISHVVIRMNRLFEMFQWPLWKFCQQFVRGWKLHNRNNFICNCDCLHNILIAVWH